MTSLTTTDESTERRARSSTTLHHSDPLKIEIAELLLIRTGPDTGVTSFVEVCGSTTDGRELVISIRGDHLERLIKSLNASIKQ